jgi:allantoinase
MFQKGLVMLRKHDRYDFSPIVQRPDWSWPNGARLAFFVAPNIEEFPYGEGLAIELNPKQREPDIPNYTWRDWGNRVGVWRMIELMDEFRIPATVLMNTASYHYSPQIAEAFRSRGDEFVGHGRTNGERQGDMDETTEAAMIRQVTATLTEREGKAPRGWMGPWVSESAVTPDLLQENGYTYTMDWACDDQPIWLRTRSGGRILAVPYARPTNDLQIMHGAKMAPSVWADILIDQIDELLLQSQCQSIVWNLSLHPYMMHGFRLRQLRRVFAHLQSLAERIWITRAGDIAVYVADLPPGTIC